ncbi:cytochrome P450, partial [Macrolepiota fuliginosa MF-IS2]
PPGPKGYPLIGSALDIPTHKAWLAYHDMFKVYGDMVYLNAFGQDFLVLGSLARTNDLFESRSSNYSDRPKSTMLVDLMGWSFSLGLLPYGSWWRRHRR